MEYLPPDYSELMRQYNEVLNTHGIKSDADWHMFNWLVEEHPAMKPFLKTARYGKFWRDRGLLERIRGSYRDPYVIKVHETFTGERRIITKERS